MSQANVELFYAKLKDDPALLNSLSEGATTQAEVIKRAVAAGQAQGLDFTAPEAQAWVTEQTTIGDDGELSDTQLEGVAGGKGGKPQGVIGAFGTLFGL